MLSTSKFTSLSDYYIRSFTKIKISFLKLLNASELLSSHCAYAYFCVQILAIKKWEPCMRLRPFKHSKIGSQYLVVMT